MPFLMAFGSFPLGEKVLYNLIVCAYFAVPNVPILKALSIA